MEFQVGVSDIRGRVSQERMEIVFHSNEIVIKEQGRTYYLEVDEKDERKLGMLVIRDTLEIRVGSKLFNAGARFVEESGEAEDIVLKLDEIKKYPNFVTAFELACADAMEKKRKEVYEALYEFLTVNNGLFGKKMVDYDGCGWSQIADPIMDMYLGYDENRKSIYIFLEYTGSGNDNWQNSSYRAYFDELHYDEELERLKHDLILMSKHKADIVDKFNDGPPVNTYFRGFKLRPFSEFYHEPMVMFYMRDGEDEKEELIREAIITKSKTNMLIDKKHLIIPAGCLTIKGKERVVFENVETIVLEINSEDLIVDNGEEVLMRNPHDGEEEFDMEVYHLIMLDEVRRLARHHCPMRYKDGSKRIASLEGHHKNTDDEKSEPVYEAQPVDNPLKRKKKSPNKDAESSIPKSDVILLNIESDRMEIHGNIDRLLDEGKFDELREFMKKVGEGENGYYYKQ